MSRIRRQKSPTAVRGDSRLLSSAASTHGLLKSPVVARLLTKILNLVSVQLSTATYDAAPTVYKIHGRHPFRGWGTNLVLDRSKAGEETSHHPAFVNPYSIPAVRVHRCNSSSDNGNNLRRALRRVSKLVASRHREDHSVGLPWRRRCAQMDSFSSMVLHVETTTCPVL